MTTADNRFRFFFALSLFLTVSVISVFFLALPQVAHGAHNKAPVNPLRDPHGRVIRNTKQQMVSSNWSGYAVAGYQSGKTYTAATATWIVPSVISDPSYTKGYSSSWVGIGGFCLNSLCTRVDNSLIQLGTEQDYTGSGSYYAWYEMLPQAETVIPSFKVNPGDVITATLQVIATNKRYQTWKLTLANATTIPQQQWTGTFNYKSSLSSAEWIQEAPYSGGILPLANYGTATFNLGSADGSNPNLNSSQAVVMQNPNGQTSNPSNPDRDTDGFNTCWGSRSNTPCPTPTN